MGTKSKPITFKGCELARASAGVERDLLNVLLEPERQYTQKEADDILIRALEKGVKTNAGW